MKNQKKEPWRIIVAIISIAFIIYMWIEKDISGLLGNLKSKK